MDLYSYKNTFYFHSLCSIPFSWVGQMLEDFCRLPKGFNSWTYNSKFFVRISFLFEVSLIHLVIPWAYTLYISNRMYYLDNKNANWVKFATNSHLVYISTSFVHNFTTDVLYAIHMSQSHNKTQNALQMMPIFFLSSTNQFDVVTKVKQKKQTQIN